MKLAAHPAAVLGGLLPTGAVRPTSALPGGCVAQEATGYKLEVATVRRLEFENDTFAFGDKLIKKWYSGEQKVGLKKGGRGGVGRQRWQQAGNKAA